MYSVSQRCTLARRYLRSEVVSRTTFIWSSAECNGRVSGFDTITPAALKRDDRLEHPKGLCTDGEGDKGLTSVRMYALAT